MSQSVDAIALDDEGGIDVADLPADQRAAIPAPPPDPVADGVTIEDAPMSREPALGEFGMISPEDLPVEAREKLNPSAAQIPPEMRAPEIDCADIPAAALLAAGLPVPPPRSAVSARPRAPAAPRAGQPSALDVFNAHRRACAACGTAAKKSGLCAGGKALYSLVKR